MYVPNPLIFGDTPDEGETLTVTPRRGGMVGYILLGISGPETVFMVNGTAPQFPYVLQDGDVLFMQRVLGGYKGVTTVEALAPVDNEPIDLASPASTSALAVQTDSDGFQTITNANAVTDSDGFQSIPDATATADEGGYESVERSTQ